MFIKYAVDNKFLLKITKDMDRDFIIVSNLSYTKHLYKVY